MWSPAETSSRGTLRGNGVDFKNYRIPKKQNTDGMVKAGVVNELNSTLPVEPTPLALSGSELLRKLQSTRVGSSIEEEEEVPSYTPTPILPPVPPATTSETSFKEAPAPVEPSRPLPVSVPVHQDTNPAVSVTAQNPRWAPNRSFGPGQPPVHNRNNHHNNRYRYNNYQMNRNGPYNDRRNYHREHDFRQNFRPAQRQNFDRHGRSFNANTTLPVSFQGTSESWRQPYPHGRLNDQHRVSAHKYHNRLRGGNYGDSSQNENLIWPHDRVFNNGGEGGFRHPLERLNGPPQQGNNIETLIARKRQLANEIERCKREARIEDGLSEPYYVSMHDNDPRMVYFKSLLDEFKALEQEEKQFSQSQSKPLSFFQ